MSPAFSSNAADSLAICSATFQTHVLQVGVLLDGAVHRQRDRALGEMAGLGGRVDRAEHRGTVEALADLPRLLLVAHRALQIAPRHVEADARSRRRDRAPSPPGCWCRPTSAPPPVRPRSDSSWSARDRDDRRRCRSRRSGSRRSASGRRTAARGSDPNPFRAHARRSCARCSRCGGPETRRSRRRSEWSSPVPERSTSGRPARRPERSAAAPASARAPVVRMVLRSRLFMMVSLVRVSCSAAVFTAFSHKLHGTCALLHCSEPRRRSLRPTAISTAEVPLTSPNRKRPC